MGFEGMQQSIDYERLKKTIRRVCDSPAAEPLKPDDPRLKWMYEQVLDLIDYCVCLKQDQDDWNKGVELIDSTLGDRKTGNKSCVAVAQAVLELKADMENRTDLLREVVKSYYEHSLGQTLVQGIEAHLRGPSKKRDVV